MPFSSIKSEISSRFIEINTFLNSIKTFEDSVTPPALHPIEYKIYKGLFYVHLYAGVEFAINKTVVDTLSLIKGKNVVYHHLENRFYTVALHSNLQSVRDCNSKVFLDKSADLFQFTESLDVSSYDETLILKYIQNIWGKTFNQLTKTLGVSAFAISPIEIRIFDEIVENRNKVAHGRDSAANVGSAPKYVDLKSKFDVVHDVINRYVSHIEQFYINKEFIIAIERPNY